MTIMKKAFLLKIHLKTQFLSIFLEHVEFCRFILPVAQSNRLSFKFCRQTYLSKPGSHAPFFPRACGSGCSFSRASSSLVFLPRLALSGR